MRDLVSTRDCLELLWFAAGFGALGGLVFLPCTEVVEDGVSSLRYELIRLLSVSIGAGVGGSAILGASQGARCGGGGELRGALADAGRWKNLTRASTSLAWEPPRPRKGSP